MGEFELIRGYFLGALPGREEVRLGIGDDAALLAARSGMEWAVSVDTLVAGVHFPLDTPPADIGWKALAVNLSDLAAMGAEPVACTLALTLPQADSVWLEGFAQGFAALAARHRVALIGGDTTRGPLSITVGIHGLLPAGTALLRSGAQPGDVIGVTGSLGGAGLALRHWLAGARSDAALLMRLLRPEPRVAAGLALRGIASACIDVSDGLAADLGHVLAASGVGGVIELARLPLEPAVQAEVADADYRLPLSAGDDYELCFTVPPERQAQAEAALAVAGTPCRFIGRIEAGQGLRCLLADGRALPPLSGYEHFA
jgi:thiamine-monophosphate kinase